MEQRYPRRVDPNTVFTQETLDRLTTSIMFWQQGPGNLGALHLHACWGVTSVLTRRYHGQSISMGRSLLHGAMRLFEATGNLRWKRMADDVITNILFLQAPNGGFIHAVAELEPAYVPEETCTIHQFLPILTLLEYAAWAHGDHDLQARIRPAIDRHWEWSLGYLWRSGNAWQHPPLEFPGWCGVTNQDLVAITSLVLYAQLYGDASRFVEFGEPTLEVYLGPDYYFPAIGLMERGDGENFVERTGYYSVVLSTLETIRAYTGREQLQEVIDNIAGHVFDAIFTWEDGQSHLSWGAETWPDDKTSVRRWLRTPITLNGYPETLKDMQRFLARHPDETGAAQVAQLERTLASYVFADGTIPGALGATDPIFSIVTSPVSGALAMWLFLIDRLGEELRSPAHAPTGCIHRVKDGLKWKSNERMWAIEKDGHRLFAGLKLNPGAVVIGPDETIAGGDLAELDRCDVLETLEF